MKGQTKDTRGIKGHTIGVQNHHSLKSYQIGNIVKFSKKEMPAEASKLNSLNSKSLNQATHSSSDCI